MENNPVLFDNIGLYYQGTSDIVHNNKKYLKKRWCQALFRE